MGKKQQNYMALGCSRRIIPVMAPVKAWFSLNLKEVVVGTKEYYNQLARMSLAELSAELQTEMQALNEILADEPYEDRGRQISETRENIREIKAYMARKSSF